MIKEAALGLYAMSQVLQNEGSDKNPFIARSQCDGEVPIVVVDLSPVDRARTITFRDSITGEKFVLEVDPGSTGYTTAGNWTGMSGETGPKIESQSRYTATLANEFGVVEGTQPITTNCTPPVTASSTTSTR